MKVLAAIFFLVIGARAQVGPSGMILADGTPVQFTAEQANNIASIGPSGIVTNDGRNIQLPAGQESFTAADIPTPAASVKAPLPEFRAGGLVGAAGIVHEDGNTQFTREQADNIVVAGPSGVVTKDGRNIQFRTKRALAGPSGMILADGTPIQFTVEQASNIASIGPSGIVTNDGRNIQLPAGQESFTAADIPTPVASAPAPLPELKAGGVVGASGIVHEDGNTQFTREQADNIVVAGPSGIVTKDGRNIQFRTKRALAGPSGMILADGTPIQFTVEQANNIASIGPSGIVTNDGRNIQLPAGQESFTAADIPTPVASAPAPLLEFRAGGLVGAAGIVHEDGNTQFTREQADNIVVAGPSGVVTKDGRNIQFRTKRALVGPSGLILADGTQVQFRADEMAVRSSLTDEENLNAVVIGPSGIVNRDGKNTQLQAPDAPTVLLDGPSGQVMSDGSLIQKVVKRSLIGPSGMFWNGVPVQFSHEEGQLRSGLTPEQYSNAIVVGPSGIVGLDGKNTQFAAPAAPYVLLDGPSGQVMSDGSLVQKRAKRSAGYVSTAGNIGYSGILRADGSTDLFSHDFAHNIVLIGPSGIVTRDGTNAQLTSDLHLV